MKAFIHGFCHPWRSAANAQQRATVPQSTKYKYVYRLCPIVDLRFAIRKSVTGRIKDT
jgi:hypothetical protein